MGSAIVLVFLVVGRALLALPYLIKHPREVVHLPIALLVAGAAGAGGGFGYTFLGRNCFCSHPLTCPGPPP